MSIFRNRLALVALSGLLMAGTTGAVLAQPYSMSFDQPGPGGGRGGVTLEALTARLKLTDDQQTKLKPILADRDKAMTDMRADQSASREDRMAKMMKLNADVDTKITAVLTDDQKVEYKKMQAERPMRGGGGAMGGPPPQ